MWAQIGARGARALPFRFAVMQTDRRAEDWPPYLFIKPAAIAEISRLRIVKKKMDRAEAEKNIAQLREKIRKHDRLYYQDAAPIISDREYDQLYKELVHLERQFPDLRTPDSPTQH